MDLVTLLIIVLLVLWVGGVAMPIGGSAIHALLLIVLVLVVVRLIQGRKI